MCAQEYFWIDLNLHEEQKEWCFFFCCWKEGGSSPCPHPLVIGNGSFLLHTGVQQWYLTLSLFSAINQKDIKQPTSYCWQPGRRKNEAHNYPDGSIMLPRNIINVCNNSCSISLTWHVKMTAIYKFVNNMEYLRICEWFSDSKWNVFHSGQLCFLHKYFKILKSIHIMIK